MAVGERMSAMLPEDHAAVARRIREREQVAALQQERDELRLTKRALAVDLERAFGDLDAALAALAKYGRHEDGCALLWGAKAGVNVRGRCDCGLDAALAAAREHTRKETT